MLAVAFIKNKEKLYLIQKTSKEKGGNDVLLIYEYAFGVDATNEEMRLSREHTKMEWLPYDEAIKKLKWDSNKNALWELNYHLINNKY